MPNDSDAKWEEEIDKLTKPTIVASVLNGGLSIIETRHRGHEHLLETFDEEMIKKLEKLADKGETMPEMAKAMGAAYIDLLRARMVSEEFDHFCLVLETRAATTHLKKARAGVGDPKAFSAAAFDRVMSTLNFTSHVENVHVHVSGGDEKKGVESVGSQIGFNVETFMQKHSGEVIDAEVISDTTEEDESNLTVEDIL